MAHTQCQSCDGDGFEVEYLGLEMKPVQTSCAACKGSGKVEVGVFDPICARHCTVCDGSDHHWMPNSEPDDAGEPLLGCKHCPAVRHYTDADDETADF